MAQISISSHNSHNLEPVEERPVYWRDILLSALLSFAALAPMQAEAALVVQEKNCLKVMSKKACEVLSEVNKQRRIYRKTELKPNLECTQAAEYHAQQMQRHGFFAHVDPFGMRFRDRVQKFSVPGKAQAENILKMSPSEPAKAAVDEWMASPGHAKNILNSSYNSSGVGITGVYWVQCFTSYSEGFSFVP